MYGTKSERYLVGWLTNSSTGTYEYYVDAPPGDLYSVCAFTSDPNKATSLSRKDANQLARTIGKRGVLDGYMASYPLVISADDHLPIEVPVREVWPCGALAD